MKAAQRNYRKEYKKIIKFQEWKPYRLYQPIIQEYLNLMRTGNIEGLERFRSFGESTRHIIENIQCYRTSLEWGFTGCELSDYGWFIEEDFLDQEEISLKVNGDNACYNSITLGRSPNGTWTYGRDMTTPTSGSFSGISIFGQKFASKAVAKDHALKWFKEKFEELITKNKHASYSSKVLSKINSLLAPEQLLLF